MVVTRIPKANQEQLLYDRSATSRLEAKLVEMTGNEESKDKWLVLAMSCLNFLVNGAICYHVGVLNVAVQSTYGSDVIWTSWLMAVYSSMFALAGPVASVVINVSSCRVCVFLSGLLAMAGWSLSSLVVDVRWLFLTLTMAGVGQSLSITGGTVVLPSFFPQQTALANGIFLGCGGLAIFIHPPLAQALIDAYGLRGAFLILGGLASHSCLAALFLRPSQDEQERQKKEQLSSYAYCSNDTLRSSRKNKVLSFMTSIHRKTSAQIAVLREADFTAFLLAYIAFSIAYCGPIVYLPDFLIQFTGFSEQESAFAASLVGAGSAVARVFAGFLASDPAIGELLVFAGMNSLASMFCFFGLVLFQFHAGAYIFAVGFGIYAGGSVGLVNSMVVKMLGVDKAPIGFGLALLAFGVGSLIAPPITAALVQSFGGEAIFIFSGAMYLLTSALSAFTPCFGKSISDVPITDHTVIVAEASKPLHDVLDFGGCECDPDGAPDEKCLK
ncbi:monocarboxylate transporter 3 [Aplysia californica]|uniref:Monocarboxylate transporter 3 n=1 Tax=Aplysia californica TaxID=6500 RepID=A0ABM0JBU4_APLCA|nr:monocarboxylate transporter 3 [Aplysia californica]